MPIFAEANLPFALDDVSIGDQYLMQMNSRPDNWRLRMPQFDEVKQTNDALTQDMTFNSVPFACTLDSFAAFAADTSEEGVTAAQLSDTGGIISPGPSVAPASQSGNSFTDILSGIVKGITPAATTAATTAIQSALGGQHASRPAITPTPAAGSSNTGLLVVGGIAALALVMMLGRGR